MEILESKALERTLLKNWADFINIRQLINLIFKTLNEKTKIHIESKEIKASLSRFQMSKNGFLIWSEFSIKTEKNKITGTIEFELDYNNVVSNVSLFLQ